MKRERLNCNGNSSKIKLRSGDYIDDKYVNEEEDPLPVSTNGEHNINNNPYEISSSPPAAVGFIRHPVSKLDTLAGVAIKYGVEVADIMKMNGLVTDLQMFAHKSLQIPLPGRHPPSASLSNASDTSRENNPRHAPSSQLLCNLFDSFQSLKLNSSQPKVSPAMSSLQCYYGLAKISQEFETGKGDSLFLEAVNYPRPSPTSNKPLSRHGKSRSLNNSFVDAETREEDPEKWNEKLIRRRQKSEADFPEMLIGEDTTGGVSSAITGKSLALRSKAAASPVALAIDVPMRPIRRSSSTSNLQDEGNITSSIWSTTMKTWKPDLQVLTPGRPIFDGLPKPTNSRKNKAALD